jgi:putative inorganic carbon (HCO3(-)) transporter
MVILALLVIPKSALYHEENKSFLGRGDTGIEYSTASRLAIWTFSLKEIAKSPFIGIGFGKGSFLKKYANHPENRYELKHSHNAFIDLTLQLGIQGLLAFLFIIYILIKTLWIKVRGSREDFYRFFVLATFVMTAGYLVRNLFDSFLLDDSLLMFWLLNGITIALMKVDNDNYLSCSRDIP